MSYLTSTVALLVLASVTSAQQLTITDLGGGNHSWGTSALSITNPAGTCDVQVAWETPPPPLPSASLGANYGRVTFAVFGFIDPAAQLPCGIVLHTDGAVIDPAANIYTNLPVGVTVPPPVIGSVHIPLGVTGVAIKVQAITLDFEIGNEFTGAAGACEFAPGLFGWFSNGYNVVLP